MPVCPFCHSPDTDAPYDRPTRIAVLSRLFPRLRRWHCRACARTFPVILPRDWRRDPD